MIIEKDARPVLRDWFKGERYDVVFGDAFGDIAIPYHLVTREFNDLVASRLKPDGIYLVNIVDGVNYDFLRSYIHTIRQTFPFVNLYGVPGESGGGAQATFVVGASKQPLPPRVGLSAPTIASKKNGAGRRAGSSRHPAGARRMDERAPTQIAA